jgi:alanyl-tRNA synthetase
MPSLNEIRGTFLDYFGKADHAITPSAPLVPQNDPTLLFVNAGMVPFKNVFTGAETPAHPRAVSSQKCVRAGGKHNDLDNVGYTARHHTFFEMLGNFSFGDYFKEQAITHAWTLLTRDFALPKDKLLVTVYHTDTEAAELWKKIAGLSDDRIIRIATNDNFWSMGDTGPCGPCSEIFFDHGPHIAGGPPGSPDEDGDRFIEIWNLVFMQFEQLAGGERLSLPKPSIDTGMGLERVAAVLQGVHNNYDVDLFKALIAASVELTGVKAEGDWAPSHRVIADHLRSTSFLLADGVTPSNEGRGYVLRRIMRRAMRHAYLLGAQRAPDAPPGPDPGGRDGPGLSGTAPRRGLDRRDPAPGGRALPRHPGSRHGSAGRGHRQPDLGRRAGRRDRLQALRHLRLPAGPDPGRRARQGHHGRHRRLRRGHGPPAHHGARQLVRLGPEGAAAAWFGIKERTGPTNFVGYENTETTGVVKAILVDGVEAESAKAGLTVEVLLDRTSFYAESGGQAGDTGVIEANGRESAVLDTQKQAGELYVHKVELAGDLKVGDSVVASVDAGQAHTTRANHSAAHLVHAALHHVLGPHVAQKGQMVDGDRMRFDFSHGGPLTADEIERIEAEVNEVIRQNVPAETKEMAPQEAIEAGAVALFGEKYGDSVRVLTLGNSLTEAGKFYSVELCGGTHVARTGDIALFKIVSEQGVAAGVRRIEALTGEAARRFLLDQAGVAKALAEQFKTPVAGSRRPRRGPDRRAQVAGKQLAEAKKQLALGGGGGAASGPEDVNGTALIAKVLDGVGGKELRGVAEEFKKQLTGGGVVALVGTSDGKAAVTVAVTADLTGKFSAADLAKAAVLAMGGQGAGGKADFAQGGAPDATKAQDGLDAIKAALAG